MSSCIVRKEGMSLQRVCTLSRAGKPGIPLCLESCLSLNPLGRDEVLVLVVDKNAKQVKEGNGEIEMM